MALRKVYFSDSAFIDDLSTRGNCSVSSASKSFQDPQLALKEINENLKKKEEEIEMLKKCKAELSDTVRNLKREVFGLQEEKLKLENLYQEMKSRLLMMSERNAALVQEKADLSLENQKVKMELLANEEKYNLKSQVSQPNLPFSTYPWHFPSQKSILPFISAPIKPITSISLEKFISNKDCKENVSESWEEVSQKLFAQMKQEMKELDEMGKKLTIQSPLENYELCENCSSVPIINSFPEENLSEEINLKDDHFKETDGVICDLQNQLYSIRKCALEQNRFARKMLQKILDMTKLGTNYSPISFINSSQRNIGNLTDNNEKVDSVINAESRFQFQRPSDESFRAYFTQQLHNGQLLSQNLQSKEEKTKTVSMIEENCDSRIVADGITVENRNIIRQNADSPRNNCLPDEEMETLVKSIVPSNLDKNITEERICPMCQELFPKTVSQNMFEMHVLSHFEIENNSILENFEVV